MTRLLFSDEKEITEKLIKEMETALNILKIDGISGILRA
jgi:hypothetical protein